MQAVGNQNSALIRNQTQSPPVPMQSQQGAAYGAQAGGQNFRVCGTSEPCSAPPITSWSNRPVGDNYRTAWDNVATRLGTQNPITVRTEIERQLYQAQGLEAYRTTDVNVGANITDNPATAAISTNSSSTAPTSEGPDPVQLGLDLTQMGIDIVGIFEPTPFADATNTLISIGRGASSIANGNWGEAGEHGLNGLLSVVGIIPYLGDTAKLGKIAKWAQTVADAVSAVAHNPALRSALEPGLRAVKDAVDGIPQSALDKLPQSARESIEGMKRQLDEFFGTGANAADDLPSYSGTVRGQSVDLPGVSTVNVNYVKRDRTEYANLRREFDNSVRSDFAKHLADPANVEALRRAGLDDNAIARLQEGKIPQGWQVHHKLPLDDGGTNSFDNLVLIKNDPYHIALTNAQRELVGDLSVGQSRQVDFPIPNGSIYPPTPLP